MGQDEGPPIESKKIARLYGDDGTGGRHAPFRAGFPGKRPSMTPIVLGRDVVKGPAKTVMG